MVPTLLFSRMEGRIKPNGYLTFNRFRHALAELIRAKGNFQKVLRMPHFRCAIAGLAEVYSFF